MARTPVELIKERLSILDVVGQYVELHKAGKSFKGRSPFTNEKTPSFFVSPDRGMYYCFSSQKGGDIFTFIQEMEGVDFKGALKILADRAHVELTPEDPKKRDARETQYALLEEATQFFWHAREENLSVNEYIESRGVKSQTVHTWRIGYAKDEWRALKEHLIAKGFSEQMLLAAGLVKQPEGGKESYDVFRDRIIFPIADSSGRIVAFSGRTLKADPGTPKYVNSPETELYKKSEVLYGYDKAKQGIRQYDFSLVVEGQFDLVLSHQAGYTNTVAVSGTAFTPYHLGLLERLSSRIVLALDADRAGIAAVKRSATLMLQHGMDVKVARMEGGKDPADIVRTNPNDLKKFVGASVHVVEFLLNVLKEGAKDERTYKLRVREEVLPLVANIQNRIDREHFEGVVADAIETTKDAIHYEIGRILEAHARNTDTTHTGTSRGPTEHGVRSSSRKHALARHILALRTLLESEHTWIASGIDNVLHELLTDDERTLCSASDDPAWQRELFELETYLARVHEKNLLEEISEKLTLLAHIVARERLSLLKVAISNAEQAGDEAALSASLKETKQAEFLLQQRVDMEEHRPQSTSTK